MLSESTERHDRGKKFEQYRKLPSLREYLLVSQDQVLVEQYTREEDGRWSFREHRAGTQVHLPSLRCELSVDTVAARVFGG
ncbi:Hypothetical protein CAP_2825 [Chondromyces apiculatus DSM 436]|uniref:Putative restriction endonuclease domain-containing protein n=1 Tax=Chondromyces apiculatus DSM 436 TaxID=1192034 RepID=A0A017T9A6_9BACT|nr:Hypothetical protein CAP_2825 [Chondromyces apiculatus DSM 436]